MRRLYLAHSVGDVFLVLPNLNSLLLHLSILVDLEYLGQKHVVVERAKSTFTMKRRVTRFSTNLCSSINVEWSIGKLVCL
ncbi:hypothetical protein DVH24_006428 [Malus domestica]|uniref:Uncharacterized protein n=1 Tax=Malus domestica TaxID=3750 RepID=A0A498KCM6_MALDO|nr:hypothetical protein DVH24_006428 [Malus domestica]